jgi:hypothetical protein
MIANTSSLSIEPRKVKGTLRSGDTPSVASDVKPKPARQLRLGYPATCASCGISLSKGAEAIWNPADKTATCLACAPAGKIDAGVAGASAAAEGERRKNRKVDAVRREFGDHAAVVAEAMATRDAAASWGKGSEGELKLATYIAEEVGDSVIALHDRRIPGTRGNIDHLFVAQTGIWVVDAKAYKGRVVRRETGPIWRRENELFIGGRNRTSLAKGVLRQVEAVAAARNSDSSLDGTDIYAALCLVDSAWGLLDTPFLIGKAWVMRPSALKKRLRKGGKLSRETMERIARLLDLSLPRAS